MEICWPSIKIIGEFVVFNFVAFDIKLRLLLFQIGRSENVELNHTAVKNEPRGCKIPFDFGT